MTRPPANSDFVPEARIYNSNEWYALSSYQKQQIQELKAANGWTNGNTPPGGYEVATNGFAAPAASLVSAVRSIIGQTSTAQSFALPPAPDNHAPIPPVIDTNPVQAGTSFGRRGSRQPPNSGQSSVSQVSINGQSHFGPIYDANQNRIA